MRELRWLLLILMTLCGFAQCIPFSNYKVGQFDSDHTPLLHLTRNKNTSAVYVSAVNRIYQLDKHLSESSKISVSTGPVNDSSQCMPYESCGEPMESKDNYNKLLLMDYGRDRLLVCGNVHQGICVARSAKDISQVVSDNDCTIDECNYKFTVSDFVACTAKDCTMVAVVAEGPTVFNPVLYIAKTAEENFFVSYISSSSVRSLHYDMSKENKLFRLAIDGLRQKSLAKDLENAATKSFKYAFSSGGDDGFVYFVFHNFTDQPHVKNTSVIARVCKKDLTYASYVEMSLTCPGIPDDTSAEVQNAYYATDVGLNEFPLDNITEGVLYTIFKTGSSSSICIFTIEDLNRAFDNTLLACLKHKGNEGPTGVKIATTIQYDMNANDCEAQTWITADQTLENEIVRSDPKPSLSYYPDYEVQKGQIRCGAQYLPSPVRRLPSHPISAPWSYSIPDVTLTAVAVHLVDGYNVAYLGTTSGKIIELNINRKQLYNTIDVGEPILSDLVLEDSTDLEVPHLYVMTPSSVYHVRVSACEQHKTCDACLQANDPYCGWCILESSCVPKASGCVGDSWLKPLSTQCIRASKPEAIERTAGGNVVTEVDLLPPGNQYECDFGSFISQAKVGDDGRTITCQAPPKENLPPDLPNKDYVDVKLSIRYNGTTDIVSTIATFYDCRAHGRTLGALQPCNSCLTSQWGNRCQWCIEKHQCTPTGFYACTTNTDECPQILSATDDSQLLSVGIPTKITMNAENLPTAITEYRCRIEIEGNVNAFEVSATRTDSQVVCDERAYTYTEAKTEVPSNVTVFWKDTFVVDTVSFNPVSFYNCSVTYDDCSLCVTSDAKYKCGWCGKSSLCTRKEVCEENWITTPASCPPPKILSFSPSSGPIQGNTQLKIYGVDMGVSVSDVTDVNVAGTLCTIKPDQYKISKEIVCLTGNGGSQHAGKVKVTVRGSSIESGSDFTYRNPTLKKLNVTAGPISGGTTITILGDNLMTGSSRYASVGAVECTVVEPLESNIWMQCVTMAVPNVLYSQKLTVAFDGYEASLEEAFSYLPDPEVSSFSTASGDMASFLAGGRDIIFVGNRLNLVQKARLVATIDASAMSDASLGSRRRRRSLMRTLVKHLRVGFRIKRSPKVLEFSGKCTISNSTHMTCLSPEVSLTIGDNITRNISDSKSVNADLTVVMDNVQLPWTGDKLRYYPNPSVRDLDPSYNDEDKVREGTLLKIQVENLRDDAIQEEEIEILIRDQRCPVESMDEILRCIVPAKPEGEESVYEVTVQIGNKIWEVGTVTYFINPGPISEGAIWGIVAGGVVIVVLIILLICFFVNKTKHYKDNKNDYQKAIENLEMSVRADFRKAFAELSIDMTDLTADIGDVGLPILGYRQYATNMFFPSVRYHPCMKEPDPSDKPIPAVEQGLTQFALLITNKHFLVLFLRTLEEQRGFSNRDKGNVASLITVVLHKKLDYFTEVMKSLISDLVAVSVQRNPKLLLRRTESVAERMFSNWMAICLFPYIRDKAGKPLFLLQKAIKHQVSKGPLDKITGKARYTLSDDRLLKEDIQCELMTLFVSQSEAHDDEPVIVKVLSCDSISQVKEKVMDAVYKRIPFSHRPKAEQLDLEWHHGRSGRLVLPDVDFASETGSRWRRVMTIKDYKVENNATMAVIQRQQDMYGSQDVVSHFTNPSPDTSVISPMLPEEGSKIYHLYNILKVKYTDDLDQKRESTLPAGSRQKHIGDMYLLRLINMKGILQSYVDEVFQAILDTSSIPVAVRHFFNYLDDQAKTHNIDDEEILHMWKTNSVLGRFWVMILKSPEAVFDIDKPEAVESSMAVISQTFIDACSVQEHKPTKDSPINKQLYAKEIPTYKKMVQKYYKDAHDMPPVSDQDMCAAMAELSRSHDTEFDVHAAYNELWGYVNKYYEEIQETLSNDPNTPQMVIQRLNQAYTLIDNSVNNP